MSNVKKEPADKKSRWCRRERERERGETKIRNEKISFSLMN